MARVNVTPRRHCLCIKLTPLPSSLLVIVDALWHKVVKALTDLEVLVKGGTVAAGGEKHSAARQTAGGVDSCDVKWEAHPTEATGV